MGERPTSRLGWVIFSFLLFCAFYTMLPNPGKASEGANSPADNLSSDKNPPLELKILDFKKNINAVDLRGVGRTDDVVIKFNQENGLATAPIIYLFLTKANNAPSSELVPVSVPGYPGRDDDFYTFISNELDCVEYTFRLAQSSDKHTFMIRAQRDLPHGMSPIRLELFQLVEDSNDDLAKPADGVSTAYRFSLRTSRDLKSTACVLDDVMNLAARTFHLKLKR